MRNGGSCDLAPLAGLQAVECPFARADADQTERGMADGSGHAAHLAVASFGECNFDPRCGDGLPKANGWITRWERGLCLQDIHLGGSRFVITDVDAFSKPLDCPG